MRILLLSSAYNSLTQLAHVELAARGHRIGLATATDADAMRRAAGGFRPDLILCPMLTRVIPRDLWQRHLCLILHPGIVGDRGGHSLDRAILDHEAEWGVTVVEAADEVDSGPIWATARCPMRPARKSSLYRDEIAGAALEAMLLAVQRCASRLFVPTPLDYARPDVRGRFRPLLTTEERRIDWSADPVATILRTIRAADGSPGVLDEVAGLPVHLYGAHPEGRLIGRPGALLARRHGAICRAATDGAVWISHLKQAEGARGEHFKLPATDVLAGRIDDLPDLPLAPDAPSAGHTFRDIWYEERGAVGTIHFDFYNGAMGTDHCRRLAAAWQHARERPTKVLVLAGGRDFFSNGIHLNLIEAAPDPAEESWRNINAMNDLVHAILTTTERLTIAALYGSAGAGGVMLALAADRVLARTGIVLNPHYKGMGGLYGSEYWTYSLPKRIGPTKAQDLTDGCQPLGVDEAQTIGLIDAVIHPDDLDENPFAQFRAQLARTALHLAHSPRYDGLLAHKQTMRAWDERLRPLQDYRRAELEQMQQNFWGADRSYHHARAAFVRKQPRAGNMACDAMHAPRRTLKRAGWSRRGSDRHAA